MRIYKTISHLILLALAAALLAPADSLAQSGSRAALVVRFDDETAFTQCVSFSEVRSGLPLAVDFDSGTAVCAISGTGCPATNCFCQCSGGGDCLYWSYWHLLDSAWQ